MLLGKRKTIFFKGAIIEAVGNPVSLIIGFIVIYYSFAGLGYAMPTVSPALYKPYQLWFFVLFKVFSNG